MFSCVRKQSKAYSPTSVGRAYLRARRAGTWSWRKFGLLAYLLRPKKTPPPPASVSPRAFAVAG